MNKPTNSSNNTNEIIRVLIELKSGEFSFCEPSFAGPRALWCIRPLTKRGRKLGGGVDTDSYCGRVKDGYGWDLDIPIGEFHLANNTCKDCLGILISKTTPSGQGTKSKER
jgi:hypothetical protein